MDIEESLERADFASHHLKGDLCASGFVINEAKSHWIPVQKNDWLGITWDFEHGVISIKQSKVLKASSIIDHILSKPSVSARLLSSFVGSIMSMSPAVSRLASIMTRHCLISIVAALDWDTEFELDEFCLVEVNFWRENLTPLNTRQFVKPVLSHSKIVYSNVSSYACGALIQGTEQFISHTMFTDQERSLSSTHRELIAIYYSLQAFEDKRFDALVKWFTDNQATARIVDVGSMKLQLHHLAYKIFSYYFQHNIDLHVQWIPRDLNTQADFGSKISDCDDWQLTSQCFGI